MPTFNTPTTAQGFQIDGALYGGWRVGLSVMRIDGEWVETVYPTQEQLDAADLYFHGGHIHPVDDETAAVLTAAGYEVTP